MSTELTDAERDNVEADVYARAMIDLAKEHPRAEGIAGSSTTLIDGSAALTIVLSGKPFDSAGGPLYTAKAGPEVKRPRTHLIAQIVAALAHDVGKCDCGKDAKYLPSPVVVCPAATDVIARLKAEAETRVAAAAVIKSISVFAKP
jgi:hypothetical protein